MAKEYKVAVDQSVKAEDDVAAAIVLAALDERAANRTYNVGVSERTPRQRVRTNR